MCKYFYKIAMVLIIMVSNVFCHADTITNQVNINDYLKYETGDFLKQTKSLSNK